MNSNLFKNAFGQFRVWFQTTGIFIVAAIVSYLVDNSEWTWSGLFAALFSAMLTYVFTRNDHKKTAQVAEGKAVSNDSNP